MYPVHFFGKNKKFWSETYMFQNFCQSRLNNKRGPYNTAAREIFMNLLIN